MHKACLSVAASLLALLLTGCGAGKDLPASLKATSNVSRNTPWPGFLPIDMILGDIPVDVAQSEAAARALYGRALRLKQRARILRGPVIEAQEKLKLQQANKRIAS